MVLDFSEVPSHRTGSNGPKLNHKFHLNIGKSFCTLRVAEHRTAAQGGHGVSPWRYSKPTGCVPVSQLWVTLPPAGIRLLCPSGASPGFSGQEPFVALCGCSWGWLLAKRPISASPSSVWEPSTSRARAGGKQQDSPDIPQPESNVTLSINTPVSPSRTSDQGTANATQIARACWQSCEEQTR